ncbi:MAG: glutamate--tRNA ligase [Deltaproteobacteria bacterium]|nr:glutamate--tRNA ligase [Deltaproteobacteria bacterium]
MKGAVRCRFAPSPTGYLHIGGARTALFNWLFARHHGGTFILRVEDTDAVRSTKASIDAIVEALSWLGLHWDEGPIFQTDRLPLYQEAADRLLATGQAYRCYCTPEELEAMRREALAAGRKPRYAGRCRERTGPVPGRAPALRFRAPTLGSTIVQDLIKGPVAFDHAELDDLIIVRSDGLPTYNFSAVVDDAAMGITHVIRGDEHLNNTPKQILLYEALGLPQPRFAHVSMILGPDKAKLSKRHGATSVQAYRELGYLPAALVNYLVRLGWSHGDQEIFSVQEMVEQFTLENVGKSAAVFNAEKLLWLNAHYLREMPPPELARLLLPFLQARGGRAEAGARLERILRGLRERSRTLVELADQAVVYYLDEVTYEPGAAKKFLKAEVIPTFEGLVASLSRAEPFQAATIQAAFEQLMAERGLKLGEVAQPVRVALTGRTVSPGIFEVIEALGREPTLSRLRRAIRWIRDGHA